MSNGEGVHDAVVVVRFIGVAEKQTPLATKQGDPDDTGMVALVTLTVIDPVLLNISA